MARRVQGKDMKNLAKDALMLRAGNSLRVSAKDYNLAELLYLTSSAAEGECLLYVENTDNYLTLAEVQELDKKAHKYVVIG